MRLWLNIALALMVIGAAVCPTSPGDPAGEKAAGFDRPEVILDGSEYGLLYPAFADIDSDGKMDLLVGIGGPFAASERLLVYRNQGTNARPVYARPRWLDDTVPSANTSDSG